MAIEGWVQLRLFACQAPMQEAAVFQHSACAPARWPSERSTDTPSPQLLRLPPSPPPLPHQGVVQALPVGRLHYQLTDAALCTADWRYGKSDLGPEAISAFMAAHTCGLLCRQAGCSGVRL